MAAVKALEGRRILQVAAGTSHSLALADGGLVYAWGSPLACGLQPSPEAAEQGWFPRLVVPSKAPLLAVREIAAGAWHSLMSGEAVPLWLRALAAALHDEGPPAMDVALDAYLVCLDGTKVFVSASALRARLARPNGDDSLAWRQLLLPQLTFRYPDPEAASDDDWTESEEELGELVDLLESIQRDRAREREAKKARAPKRPVRTPESRGRSPKSEATPRASLPFLTNPLCSNAPPPLPRADGGELDAVLQKRRSLSTTASLEAAKRFSKGSMLNVEICTPAGSEAGSGHLSPSSVGPWGKMSPQPTPKGPSDSEPGAGEPDSEPPADEPADAVAWSSDSSDTQPPDNGYVTAAPGPRAGRGRLRTELYGKPRREASLERKDQYVSAAEVPDFSSDESEAEEPALTGRRLARAPLVALLRFLYTDVLPCSVVEDTHVLLVEERSGSKPAAVLRAEQGLVAREELAVLRRIGAELQLHRLVALCDQAMLRAAGSGMPIFVPARALGDLVHGLACAAADPSHAVHLAALTARRDRTLQQVRPDIGGPDVRLLCAPAKCARSWRAFVRTRQSLLVKWLQSAERAREKLPEVSVEEPVPGSGPVDVPELWAHACVLLSSCRGLGVEHADAGGAEPFPRRAVSSGPRRENALLRADGGARWGARARWELLAPWPVDVVCTLLWFAYTESILDTAPRVRLLDGLETLRPLSVAVYFWKDLLVCASDFGFDRLRCVCEDELCNGLSPRTWPDMLLHARGLAAASSCTVLEAAAMQAGVRALFPHVQQLASSVQMDAEVDAIVGALHVPCAMDQRNGLDVLRHRHPETYKAFKQKLCDAARRHDRMRRLMKSYIAHFDEGKPETRVEAAKRMALAFPWAGSAVVLAFILAGVAWVRYREFFLRVLNEVAPWLPADAEGRWNPVVIVAINFTVIGVIAYWVYEDLKT